MNRKAAALLADLIAAGETQNPRIITPVNQRPRGVRTGRVAMTDETEKMEIAGLPCEVKAETSDEARVYVLLEGKMRGPYRLKPSEVV